MRYDAKKERWMLMEIWGVRGYFNDSRIDRATVPDGFHSWELADCDCDGEPCRYRNGILVNFYGTFLTTGNLPVDDKDWTEGYIAEDEWEILWDKMVSFEEMLQMELEEKQDETLWILQD